MAYVFLASNQGERRKEFEKGWEEREAFVSTMRLGRKFCGHYASEKEERMVSVSRHGFEQEQDRVEVMMGRMAVCQEGEADASLLVAMVNWRKISLSRSERASETTSEMKVLMAGTAEGLEVER
jgi:hypothetical protein